MIDPEKPEQAVEVAETLRDLAWEYLPDKARESINDVMVTYKRVGGTAINLTVIYRPNFSNLEICAEEIVNTVTAKKTDSSLEFIYNKNLTLNAKTGEVLGYDEIAEVRDEFGNLIESPEESAYLRTLFVPKSGESQEERTLRETTNQTLEGLEYDAFYTLTMGKLEYLMGLFDEI